MSDSGVAGNSEGARVENHFSQHASNKTTNFNYRFGHNDRLCFSKMLNSLLWSHSGWQKLAGFQRAQKMPSILSSDAYLLIRDKKRRFSRNTKIATKKVVFT